jgi:carbonic anhydrase
MSGSLKTIAAQLADDNQRALAERLRIGSRAVYREIRSRNVIDAAKLKSQQPNRRFIHDLYYRAVVLREAFKNAAFVATASLHRDRLQWASDQKRVDLSMTQAPTIAAAICSDSRVDAAKTLNGKVGDVFVLKNVGATLTRADTPNVLTDEAKAQITYAVVVLKVKQFVVFSHGRCGCIANASVDGVPHVKGPITEAAAAVFKNMASAKANAKNAMGDSTQEQAQEYIGALGFDPNPKHFGRGEDKLLAMELSDLLKSVELVKIFVKEITVPGEELVPVDGVHIALRNDFNLYMFNPKRNQFVNITGYPIMGKTNDKDGAAHGDAIAHRHQNCSHRTVFNGSKQQRPQGHAQRSRFLAEAVNKGTHPH